MVLMTFDTRKQSGGVQKFLSGPSPTYKNYDVFLVLNILQRWSNCLFQRNLIFSRVGGYNFFCIGVEWGRGGGAFLVLIPMETHTTCDFPRQVRTTCPPLDLPLTSL